MRQGYTLTRDGAQYTLATKLVTVIITQGKYNWLVLMGDYADYLPLTLSRDEMEETVLDLLVDRLAELMSNLND